MEDIPEGWGKFVDALRPSWEENDLTKELSNLVRDPEIAVAIWGCLKEGAITWLDYKAPILKKRKPIDLLKTEKGRGEIRWMLISNPWWSGMGERSKKSE